MGKIWLGVSYLVIQIHLATAAVRQDFIWHDSDFDNTVCTSGPLPVFSQVQSKLQCAAQCIDTYGCNSVFYHEGSCMLSDRSHLTMNSAVCHSFDGYKWYHKGCAPGYEWNKNARTCFRVYTECKNWLDSRSVCLSQGADLLVLKGGTFFQSYAFNTNILSCEYGGVWVGYTDGENEGTWKWMDGSQNNDEPWISGDPNGGNGENCGAIITAVSPTLLNDYPCGAPLAFVCGYKI